MLTMRNLTDRKTGRWDGKKILFERNFRRSAHYFFIVYAVSNVFERYSVFRKGAVWAKIVTPNIPVDNGVVHIIDQVMGVVSETIDQMIQQDYKVT